MRLGVDPRSLSTAARIGRLGAQAPSEDLAGAVTAVLAAMPGATCGLVMARVVAELTLAVGTLTRAVDDHARRLEVGAVAYAAADGFAERQARAALAEATR